MSQRRAIFSTMILTAIVVSIGWIGLGGGIYWMLKRNPPDFEVVVQAPDSVALGESFSLVVTVSNPKGGFLDLGSIDFSDDLLKGFELISLDPIPSSRRRTFGYLSCEYRPEKSASQLLLTMKLRAKEVGTWGGDIDCWTPLLNVVTHYTEIEVLQSSEESPAGTSANATH